MCDSWHYYREFEHIFTPFSTIFFSSCGDPLYCFFTNKQYSSKTGEHTYMCQGVLLNYHCHYHCQVHLHTCIMKYQKNSIFLFKSIILPRFKITVLQGCCCPQLKQKASSSTHRRRAADRAS